jgi:hypothetical protein
MAETKTATLEALTPAHLDGAVALSRAEGWPHRPEDWALILGLGRGIAALDGDRVIGTAMATPYGPAGTVGMIVVARDWRGRGAFLRVDTPEASGLGDWLAAQGLAPVGRGIAMVRGGAPTAAPEFQTFALAAQALG